MTQSAAPAVSRGSGLSGVRIDAEKLECYHVAQSMRALIVGLLPSASRAARDQLDRASLSVVLNIAEGAGRRAPGDKARFYSIARGSANESVALLDAVLPGDASGLAARRLLVRVIQMLSRLEARFR